MMQRWRMDVPRSRWTHELLHVRARVISGCRRDEGLSTWLGGWEGAWRTQGWEAGGLADAG